MEQRCIFGIVSPRLLGMPACKNVAALLTNCSNLCLFLADTRFVVKAERIGLELVAYVQWISQSGISAIIAIVNSPTFVALLLSSHEIPLMYAPSIIHLTATTQKICSTQLSVGCGMCAMMGSCCGHAFDANSRAMYTRWAALNCPTVVELIITKLNVR